MTRVDGGTSVIRPAPNADATFTSNWEYHCGGNPWVKVPCMSGVHTNDTSDENSE